MYVFIHVHIKIYIYFFNSEKVGKAGRNEGKKEGREEGRKEGTGKWREIRRKNLETLALLSRD